MVHRPGCPRLGARVPVPGATCVPRGPHLAWQALAQLARTAQRGLQYPCRAPLGMRASPWPAHNRCVPREASVAATAVCVSHVPREGMVGTVCCGVCLPTLLHHSHALGVHVSRGSVRSGRSAELLRLCLRLCVQCGVRVCVPGWWHVSCREVFPRWCVCVHQLQCGLYWHYTCSSVCVVQWGL